MAYDGPEPSEVFDHLMDLFDELVDGDPDKEFSPETLRESVDNMTEEQLENAYDIETVEELVAEAHDPDSGIKYH